MTNIEWTEQTWNPIVGCSVISPGCTNCYAMKMARRLASMKATPHYAGTTTMTRAGAVWTGKLALAEHKMFEPLRRRKPTRYFVNSMGDLFHEDMPDEWIDRVFAVMALCPQHVFQVLTKRPARMREYLSHMERCFHASPEAFDMAWGQTGIDIAGDGASDFIMDRPWPLPNVWLGVSVENQTEADRRIPHLLATPAAVRFVSAEPLLGPVHMRKVDETLFDGHLDSLTGMFHWASGPIRREYGRGLDWVIVGGESGPKARDMDPDWARSIRDQCADAGVPFFMKQMARKAPIPADLQIREVPK